jgi:MFS family permease
MQTSLIYSRKEKSSVLISTLLGYGIDFYNILIISFIMGAIQKSLNISLTEAGIITTVTLAGSVVGGVLFGWLGDRIGRKNSLLWTLGLFSVGAILSAFSWDFNSLLVTRAITGIGLGGEWGAGIVLFNEVWDKNRRGFGSSVIQAASTGGIAAASIVAVWSLSTFSPDWGWRVALLTGGAPILLMVYVRFWMPESKLWLEYERMRAAGELPPEKAMAANPLIEIFKGASLRYTLLGFLIVSGYMFAFYSITVFMPGYMRSLGAAPEAIRTVTIVFSTGLAIAFLVFGWFTDSLGRKVGVVGPTIISIIGFIGIYTTAGTNFPGSLLLWPLFGWYVLWGIGQTAAGMFGCWFSELYPVELRASAVSTIYMVGRGIGSVAPFVVPVVASNSANGIAGGMMVGLAAAVICAVAALLLPETAGRSFAVIETKARSAA